LSGRIRDSDVEEVRRRASLIDVAAEYMQVKKAGRQFKALCPFHTEKTPSFMLDPAKGFYFCHGCGEGGDAIKLVMKLEALSFAEAIERLAQKCGVTLRYEKGGDAGVDQKRKRLVDAHRLAAEHYHGLLMTSRDAEPARAYLKGRGFKKATVEEFLVGFALQSWDDLVKVLTRKGFSEAELIEAGLAQRSQRGTIIDVFRGRVMFPVHDLTGRPVAFGARRLDEKSDRGPKYLNSAESPIYKKGTVLYALNVAKAEVVRAGRALIVEGYTDVIALHQSGAREAVATCGTALGLEHFRLLRRFTETVVLAFDSDAAGKAAAERAFAHVQEAGVDARVLVLPNEQDPADLVLEQGERAGAAVRALAEGALPIVEYRLEREIAHFDVGRPEQQTRALRAAVPILLSVRDEIVRRKYAGWVSERTRIDANQVFVLLDRAERTGRAEVAPGDLKRVSGRVKVEREALKIALQFPAVGGAQVAEPDDFTVPAHRRIWAAMADGEREPNVLSARLKDDSDRQTLTRLAMEPPEGAGVTERMAEEIFARLKEFSLARKIDELKATLQKLNPITQKQEYHELYGRLISLEGERRRTIVV
jgi:DNA primase